MSPELRLPGLPDPKDKGKPKISMHEPSNKSLLFSDGPGLENLTVDSVSRTAAGVYDRFPRQMDKIIKLHEISSVPLPKLLAPDPWVDATAEDADHETKARLELSMILLTGRDALTHERAYQIFSKLPPKDREFGMQNTGAMFFSGMVVRHGEYSGRAIAESSTQERMENIIPLTEGLLLTMRDSEQTEHGLHPMPQEELRVSMPDTQLAKDPVLSLDARSKSVQLAEMWLVGSAMLHSADAESFIQGNFKALVPEANPKVRAIYANAIRAHFKYSEKFGEFMDDIGTVLFDPSHPKHEQMVEVFGANIDLDSMGPIVLTAALGSAKKGTSSLVSNYRAMDDLATRGETASKVFGMVKDVIETEEELHYGRPLIEHVTDAVRERNDILIQPTEDTLDLRSSTSTLKAAGIQQSIIYDLSQDDEGEAIDTLKVKVLPFGKIAGRFKFGEVEFSIFVDTETDTTEWSLLADPNKPANTEVTEKLVGVMRSKLAETAVGIREESKAAEAQQEILDPNYPHERKLKVHYTSDVGEERRRAKRDAHREQTRKQNGDKTQSHDGEEIFVQERVRRAPGIINQEEAIETITATIREEDRQMVLRVLNNYEQSGSGMRKISHRNGVFRLRAGDHRIIFKTDNEAGGLRFIGVMNRQDLASRRYERLYDL